MDTIIRHDDGTLLVPIEHRLSDDDGADPAQVARESRLLHPGEGGYDEALAEWDLQQHPDRAPAVSTTTGRQEAMAVVHAVAESPEHEVIPAIQALDDPEASGEALRHVLLGGPHAVEDFAKEVADAEGGDQLPPHEATKIIGEVLAVLDE
jgi:hypothetical protein